MYHFSYISSSIRWHVRLSFFSIMGVDVDVDVYAYPVGPSPNLEEEIQSSHDKLVSRTTWS